MRKLLLLLFVTFASQMLQAQNYNPFIFGKTYRYLYLNPSLKNGYPNYDFEGADSVIYAQRIDSVFKNENNDSVFVSFRAKYRRQTNGFASNREFDYYVKHDTIITFYNSQNPYPYGDVVYKINTKSKIGDTLNLGRNSYSKHIKNDYISFLGVSDSVKVFEITAKIGNKDSLLDEIKLSKNYGFVNIINPDYRQWNNVSFYFANIFSINDLNLGFRPSHPYKLSIGDTIVWGAQNPCHPFFGESTKDIFFVKKIDNDFNPTLYNESEFHYEAIKNNVYIGVQGSDYYEVGGQRIYTEGIGMSYDFESGGGFDCIRIVKYYKGAQGEFGERKRLTDLLTTIDNSEIAKYLNIYPNPSNKTINVNSLNNSLVTIDIYDLQGSKIKSIQSEQQLTSFDLNSGLYLLKLNVDNKVFTQKVIIK